MKKYLAFYTSPVDASQQMAMSSPEEQAKGMELWMQWAKKCGDKLIDLGAPLTGGQKLTPEGVSASNLKLTGYSILQAENMEEVKTLMQAHPHLGWNPDCTIEIYETMSIPGM
jgi:hypothetical protein